MPISIAEFRFYSELRDFLKARDRSGVIVYRFTGTPAVKDAIEAIGIPHPEVDLILVHGTSVGFAHPLKDGDHVSVYPFFRSIDISPVTRVRVRQPPEPVAFVLDGHLARLAAYLRLLGMDTVWDNAADDAELADTSARESRILLTRDTGLLKRSIVARGYWVREALPKRQWREVIARFNLLPRSTPFSRCLACNGILTKASIGEAGQQAPALVLKTFKEFFRCRTCGRIYWKGSHFTRMLRLLQDLKAS